MIKKKSNGVNGSNGKKEGAFIVLYGVSKAGKTVCTGAASASGLVIAQPGALLPLRTFLGMEHVEERRAETLEMAIVHLRKEGAKYPVVAVDDFSVLVERSFNGNWKKLTSDVYLIRDIARELTQKGTTIIFNCHEQPERTSSGKYIRGGPALPGQMPEKFCALADVVLRAVYDDTAAPWPFVLHARARGNYIAGDRISIFVDGGPMNIAEGLREAGYDVPRPKGMEWQEKLAESAAKKILANGIEDWRDSLKEIIAKVGDQKPKPQIRWALQDGLHRAVLRNARIGILDGLVAETDNDAII